MKSHIDKWPKVSAVQQQTLEDLIQSLDCIEKDWPHVTDSVERFVGGSIQDDQRSTRPGAREHVFCRASELDDQNADAQIHPFDERFLEETGEPESGLRLAFRAL